MRARQGVFCFPFQLLTLLLMVLKAAIFIQWLVVHPSVSLYLLHYADGHLGIADVVFDPTSSSFNFSCEALYHDPLYQGPPLSLPQLISISEAKDYSLIYRATYIMSALAFAAALFVQFGNMMGYDGYLWLVDAIGDCATCPCRMLCGAAEAAHSATTSIATSAASAYRQYSLRSRLFPGRQVRITADVSVSSQQGDHTENSYYAPLSDGTDSAIDPSRSPSQQSMVSDPPPPPGVPPFPSYQQQEHHEPASAVVVTHSYAAPLQSQPTNAHHHHHQQPQQQQQQQQRKFVIMPAMSDGQTIAARRTATLLIFIANLYTLSLVTTFGEECGTVVAPTVAMILFLVFNVFCLLQTIATGILIRTQQLCRCPCNCLLYCGFALYSIVAVAIVIAVTILVNFHVAGNFPRSDDSMQGRLLKIANLILIGLSATLFVGRRLCNSAHKT